MMSDKTMLGLHLIPTDDKVLEGVREGDFTPAVKVSDGGPLPRGYKLFFQGAMPPGWAVDQEWHARHGINLDDKI